MKIVMVLMLISLPVGLMVVGAIVASDWLDRKLRGRIRAATGWSDDACELVVTYLALVALVSLVWFHVSTLLNVFDGVLFP